MSTPSADPSRLQTRAKNANQHPGDAIVKRKRRTKAEMEVAREQDRQIAEAAKKVKEEQIQAAAKMEDEIVARDKRAAGGIATKKVKAKVSTKTAKKAPALVPVVPQVSRQAYTCREWETDRSIKHVTLGDDSDSGQKTGDVNENDEDGAPADPTRDCDDGNVTESGEASEDDEQPRRSRKVQRGETREIIREKRKAAAAAEVDDDGEGEGTSSYCHMR